MTLDLDFVRRQFPALAGDWVFFDNAGGSQTLRAVTARISDYLLSSDVQHGASYAVSRLAVERVSAATRAMAEYVNAADASEIVMGPSTSMLIRILALCLGRTFASGDNVILTNCDHEANIGPWGDLERRGVEVRWWKVRPDSLDLRTDDLRRLINHRTRLVAVTHASNVLGTINPIREFADVAHEHGAMICVDGVAYAPHSAIDVRALDVDFYAFSFYKVYGPHYALLYGKRDHLLAIPGINHFFIGNEAVPYKFQPGSVNYELCYGMLGLTDYVRALAAAHTDGVSGTTLRADIAFVYDLIAEHEQRLAARLLDYLAGKANVRVIGLPVADRGRRFPTVSFVVANTMSDAITRRVDKHKIGIRFGDFYARRLIDDLGLAPQNGVVRVSMVHYNTLDEVDRLIEVLDRIF